jgi:Na+/H+ antiporter NhaD/arsenite permease-like protein
MALAMSANLGSVATLVGNLQNMIILLFIEN